MTELIGNFNIEAARQARRIEPFVTDYLPDDRSFTHKDRVSYYGILKDQLGITSVRTEFRMKDLLDKNGQIVEETVARYGDSLRAMKEAGLSAPTLVLFTPSNEQYDVAKADPKRFVALYGACADRIAALCQETGVAPARVQAMNEVNTAFQTKVGNDMTIELIHRTAEAFKPKFPETKIITTVLTAGAKDWQGFTKQLLAKAGSSLDGVGFDYYPGTYENPAGIPIIGKKPYEAFAGTTPYRWIADEKLHGVLKGKDVILAEIGAPAIVPEDIPDAPKVARDALTKLGYDYRHQRFGYDRIVQTLDHFFLDAERKGVAAHDIFSAIGFFQGGRVQGVDTKAPWGIDFVPFTLLRKDTNGSFQPTEAGKRLSYLIQTRLGLQQ